MAKLRDEMLHAAGEMRFEDAAKLRDRLRELEALELAR
jgi:excinuclease UvrABC nuclease subunit